ncbi:MAG: NADH-quinone oxidoreductase subunit C [Gemmatimonadota bacterium]|jgi:NADH/F420H2 dehydrogenase subunit C
MTDDNSSGLDALEEGPRPSDPETDEAPKVGAPDPADHASVAALMEEFGDAVLHHEVVAGDQHVVHVDPERNLEILRWLFDEPDHDYKQLADVTGVDLGDGAPIQVVYQLFSLTHKRALRVKCLLPLDALEIESVASLWKTADWLEREVYDLFGVTFKGHPDHRRILMPQDYAEGHPLRKDFPLRGRFSRAEQTRRALAQDVARFYGPEELIESGEPQEVSGHPAADSASTGAAGEASTPAQTEGDG